MTKTDSRTAFRILEDQRKQFIHSSIKPKGAKDLALKQEHQKFKGCKDAVSSANPLSHWTYGKTLEK